jgi:hypothetical protein
MRIYMPNKSVGLATVTVMVGSSGRRMSTDMLCFHEVNTLASTLFSSPEIPDIV